MKNNATKILFLFILIFVFFFLLGGNRLFVPQAETRKDFQYLSLFSEIVAHIKANYVTEVDPEQKFTGAFSGLVGSLDSYSAYLDPILTQRFRDFLDGRLCSAGIYGGKSFGYFMITGLETGSPGELAGLKAGILIKAVNGQSLYGLSFWEMYLSLSAPAPQPLELTLFRENRQDIYKIKVNAETHRLRVTTQTVGERFWLIQIPRFDSGAAAELKTILSGLQFKGKPGIILDLRRYAGGNADGFREIAAMLIPAEIPLTVQYRDKAETLRLGSANTAPIPTVVLIDRSTRLYAELLARLLLRVKTSGIHPAVRLLGAKTSGFMVQLASVPLEDGDSLLLTEANYILDNQKLAGAGVAPDVVIPENKSGDIVSAAVRQLKSLARER